MAEERLEEVRRARLAKREALLAAGRNPYPAEARRTHTTAAILQHFDQLREEKTPLIVTGRVLALRRHGGAVFLDLADAYGKLQIQFSLEALGAEVFQRLETLDTGDFLQLTGMAAVTRRGVPSLFAQDMQIISKSIRPLPSTWYGLKDHEARFRNRELDLLLNDEAASALKVRGQVLSWWRVHLAEAGFMEVETPVLQTLAGGATARPFTTHHEALGVDLYLRIAPELFLKRLLVGGYEKVFEVARCFRNEGVDREHNPEFTLLELYWAYADYEDLMEFTENMFAELTRELKKTSEIVWQEQTISFAAPLPRIRFVDVMNDRIGLDILTEKNPAAYVPLFQQHGLTLPEGNTYRAMVDALYKELVRPNILQPTLLYDYPVEMTPLAKQAAADPRIAERFQLVAGGMELVNAYTEQNDPVHQREIFKQQHAARATDAEAHSLDEDFLRALEYGMPPAAGWGLGVDRLVMLLANLPTLRDTLAFPLLRPE
ncbi:MAG: lysine--tRNA ligase [Candidatus Andersenbacteria bacterium CG10_big_fil_rev_8_21_14_0_10_54_11]|uniref:Lysine--tRNA ligase n=1 Tax=Candidatus Andersenbacteria bacterium CG10_big_fil_rev_8_21_14_0_10_54_11 TaxID=1974485 RepID=A0A2M6WYJ2_9BACT|nr:MAG: lysine--tRNA ligase [Candidatus Andersenbacteria bacterium CG10_big_fil_rev_8_21_14_0_10_54_11]